MNFARTPVLKALVLLTLGAMILGVGPVLVRFAKPAAPEVIAFWRMLIALPFLALIAKFSNTSQTGLSSGSNKERAMAFSAGVFLACDLACWHSAIMVTKVANATLLIGLSPFWVAFMSALYPGLRLSTRFFVALILCFGGMSMLTSVTGFAPQLGRGEILSIVASIFYAIYTYLYAMICKRMNPTHALTWSTFGSATFMFVVAFFRAQNLWSFEVQTWLAFIGLGIIIQVMAWLLISRSLKDLHATVGSLGLLGQQLATVFFGWLLLDERLGAIQLVGCVIMLVGMALGGRWAPRPKEIMEELG